MRACIYSTSVLNYHRSRRSTSGPSGCCDRRPAGHRQEALHSKELGTSHALRGLSVLTSVKTWHSIPPWEQRNALLWSPNPTFAGAREGDGSGDVGPRRRGRDLVTAETGQGGHVMLRDQRRAEGAGPRGRRGRPC